MRRLLLANVALVALATAPSAWGQARYVHVRSNAETGTVWAEGPTLPSVEIGMLGGVLAVPVGATHVRLVSPPYALSAPLPTNRDTALVRLDVPVVPTPTVLHGAPVRFVTRRAWVDGTALAVALAGTAVSVHYKFQADRLFADYEQTGNPLLRPDIEALDRKAAFALGVGMVGLTVFTVRLALR